MLFTTTDTTSEKKVQKSLVEIFRRIILFKLCLRLCNMTMKENRRKIEKKYHAGTEH